MSVIDAKRTIIAKTTEKDGISLLKELILQPNFSDKYLAINRKAMNCS